MVLGNLIFSDSRRVLYLANNPLECSRRHNAGWKLDQHCLVERTRQHYHHSPYVVHLFDSIMMIKCRLCLKFSAILVLVNLVASSHPERCASPPQWQSRADSGNASQPLAPWQTIAGNVTLVVLTSLGQESHQRNEQQTHNLELIYRSLLNSNFSNVRFILINSKNATDLQWVNKTREQVSFEVYQETDSLPVWSFLAGKDGDMFIYDRHVLVATCGH